MNKMYDEIKTKERTQKTGSKNRWGRKINPARNKRDKEGLGIKYSKVSTSLELTAGASTIRSQA